VWYAYAFADSIAANLRIFESSVSDSVSDRSGNDKALLAFTGTDKELEGFAFGERRRRVGDTAPQFPARLPNRLICRP